MVSNYARDLLSNSTKFHLHIIEGREYVINKITDTDNNSRNIKSIFRNLISYKFQKQNSKDYQLKNNLFYR
jgi:hypothetical protein